MNASSHDRLQETAMPVKQCSLGDALAALRKHYGKQLPLPTREPFELVLLESVAYLAPPLRKREAFERLRRNVGTQPAAILAASSANLESVTSLGILKDRFAHKLRECARIALEVFGGDLRAALQADPDRAVRTLRRFPGVGEPGAEKILLFCGLRASLAPESNGLRVMVRLGLIQQHTSYARMYAAARIPAGELQRRFTSLQQAHLLLQRHGQALCTRKAPQCSSCPLDSHCAHAAVRELPK